MEDKYLAVLERIAAALEEQNAFIRQAQAAENAPEECQHTQDMRTDLSEMGVGQRSWCNPNKGGCGATSGTFTEDELKELGQ
jgi:hypothetical protein